MTHPAALPGEPKGYRRIAWVTSIALLQVLAFANFLDLVPVVADALGLWTGGYYYALVSLPLTALTLILGSFAIGLGKWAYSGRKLDGAVLYLFVATLLFITAKFGLFWLAYLRSGHYLSPPLWFVVVVVAGSAIWTTLREAGRPGGRRAGVYVWSLLVGLLLIETAVFAFRAVWG